MIFFVMVVAVIIVCCIVNNRGKVKIPKGSLPNPMWEISGKEILDVDDYIVLDTETTGLNAQEERIIEVAAIRVQNGITTGRYSTFVNPGKKVPEKITKLTGITNEQAKSGKQYAVMAHELSVFMGDLPMVAHNSNFDAKFVEIAFRVGGIRKKINHIDTIPMAREAFPNMANYKLATLIPALHLANGPQTHRAMDDVLATAELFKLCKGKLKAMNEIASEMKTLSKAEEALEEAKSAVDIFLAYDKADAALMDAILKSPESILELYGGREEYLSKTYGQAVNAMMRKEFEKEKKAIQRLKTRKSMDNHIAAFRLVYDNNEKRLTRGNRQMLSKYVRELGEVRDMVSPE